jgi:hypothetical protein
MDGEAAADLDARHRHVPRCGVHDWPSHRRTRFAISQCATRRQRPSGPPRSRTCGEYLDVMRARLATREGGPVPVARSRGARAPFCYSERVVAISNLIDPDLWKRADWQGVGYGSSAVGKPPLLAFGFTNSEAGQQILGGLHAATGPIDTFDLIRIAIIEGDIPGERPGYTVHICPNFDGVMAKAAADGKEPPDVLIASMIHRIYPLPGSRRLDWFKQELATHGRYFLMGASISPSGMNPMIDQGIAIEKTGIVFKHVSQIATDEVDDAVIFTREMKQRPH